MVLVFIYDDLFCIYFTPLPIGISPEMGEPFE